MLLKIEEFIKSPFVSIEIDNWQIDDDAPEDLKVKFHEFKNQLEENKKI